MPGSIGEMIIGVSQWKRNDSPCFGAGVTFCAGRPNALRLAGDFVLARHVAVLRLAVDDARVATIRDGDEAVAALHLEPVVVADAAAVGATWLGPHQS